jgi:hypothetical protein
MASLDGTFEPGGKLVRKIVFSPSGMDAEIPKNAPVTFESYGRILRISVEKD